MHYEDEYVIKNAKLTIGIYIHNIINSDPPDQEFEITHVSECHLVNTKLLTFFINEFSLWSYKEIDDLKFEINELEDENASLDSEVIDLECENDLLHEEIGELESRVSELERE